MNNYTTYRTAESVSPKHPDKLCDRISDAILDAFLEGDPDSRVAVETCGGHGEVFIVGEVTSRAQVSDDEIKSIVARIAGDDLNIHIKLVKQSPEIAQGVDVGGAGDQGIMIGYATNETPEMLPLEVVLARELNKHICLNHYFDGKTQVTLKDENGKTEISSIVASFQNVPKAELEASVRDYLAKVEESLDRLNITALQAHSSLFEVIRSYGEEKRDDPATAGVVDAGREKSMNALTTRLYINPSGDWHQGGFDADTGLTGRKLIVDNYGPRVPIGGGAFSGKDPSKVDRSAAYMARRIAVDYLRARKAKEVFVRLAYAIGYAEPLEATVIIDGAPEVITGYDLTPQGIINFLDLKRPIYEPTACFGHFGEGFDWDK